jgi:hypothetical protein
MKILAAFLNRKTNNNLGVDANSKDVQDVGVNAKADKDVDAKNVKGENTTAIDEAITTTIVDNQVNTSVNQLEFPICISKFHNCLDDRNDTRYSTLCLYTSSTLYYDDHNYHSRDEIFDDERE